MLSDCCDEVVDDVFDIGAVRKDLPHLLQEAVSSGAGLARGLASILQRIPFDEESFELRLHLLLVALPGCAALPAVSSAAAARSPTTRSDARYSSRVSCSSRISSNRSAGGEVRISLTAPASDSQQIFRALDRVSKCPVGGVQRCRIAETDRLFGLALVLIEIRMKGAAQFVKFGFELLRNRWSSRRGNPRHVK